MWYLLAYFVWHCRDVFQRSVEINARFLSSESCRIAEGGGGGEGRKRMRVFNRSWVTCHPLRLFDRGGHSMMIPVLSQFVTCVVVSFSGISTYRAFDWKEIASL